MAFLKPDGSSFTVYAEQVFGLGQSGIVVRRGEHALKIAKIRDPLSMPQDKREDEDYISHVTERSCKMRDVSMKCWERHSGIGKSVDLLPDRHSASLLQRWRSVPVYFSKRRIELVEKKRLILYLIETVAH